MINDFWDRVHGWLFTLAATGLFLYAVSMYCKNVNASKPKPCYHIADPQFCID